MNFSPASCPICSTRAHARSGTSPYHTCPSCGCWFQWPQLPQAVDSLQATLGDSLGESEKAVHEALADHLLHELLGGKPETTLSIGLGSSYVARRLRQHGCESQAIPDLVCAPASGSVLDAPISRQDLNDTCARLSGSGSWRAPHLITLVNVFECLRNPLTAIRNLRTLVAEGGCVFVRLPDHDVPGSARETVTARRAIHPFYYTLSSILELLVQAGDCFALSHTSTAEGRGERNIVLRPIARKPTLGAGMIVTNGGPNLARCLKSIESVVDGVVVIDTGSIGTALDVGVTTIDKMVVTETYLDASRKDASGDWKLWDFGKARNRFVDAIESAKYDWLLWIDADDTLRTLAAIRRALYWTQFDLFGVRIDDGRSKWVDHRLWKTGRGIRFEGRCYEHPTYIGHSCKVLDDTIIRRSDKPGSGEDANSSNLRILTEEWTKNPDPRTAFYLADTYRCQGRWKEAVEWYQRRIAIGDGDRNEWLSAWLYMARSQRAAKEYSAASRTLRKAIWHDDSWAEFWMELAFIALERGELAEARSHASIAVDRPIAPVNLCHERNQYVDRPLRLIPWANQRPGNQERALFLADLAAQRSGGPNPEWSERIVRLQAARADAARAERPAIAINRPGAIGDILMTLNLIPALRAANRGHAIHYFCDRRLGVSGALREPMLAAGVDVIEDCAEFWSRCGEFRNVINLIGYPLAEGYPERRMSKHLLQYFAAEMKLELDGLPALRLERPKRPTTDTVLPEHYATLQAKAGWSAYKNWPLERWEATLRSCPDVPVIQIGAADEPRVPGAIHAMMGRDLGTAIALVANARMHIGVDSFANHLTNYLWVDERGDCRRVPGVILWGSTQVSASGYPHNTNISLALACQPCFREDPAISSMPRGPCINPPGQVYADPRHACMYGISTETVVEAIRKLWDRVTVESFQASVLTHCGGQQQRPRTLCKAVSRSRE